MLSREIHENNESHITMAKSHGHKAHPTAHRPHNAAAADADPEHAMSANRGKTPVPDTGVRPTEGRDAHDKPLFSLSSHSTSHSTTSHSALPTTTILPSAALTTPMHSHSIATNLHAISTSSSISPSASATADNAHTHPTHNISAAIIALLAVGSACTLIILALLFRHCRKPPKRRQHPTPSLPILQDPFRDEETLYGKEGDSPLFGGKERFSPEVGSNGQLWTWTQYNQAPAVVLPAQAVAQRDAIPRKPVPSEKSQDAYPAAPPMPPPAALASFQYPAPVQQASNAITRAVSRLSAASLSIYPTSPQIPAHEVGLAIDCSSGNGFTGDHQTPRRDKPKGSLSKNRLSVASPAPRGSTMLAYEGSDIGSPTMTETPAVPALPSSMSAGGRHRVKSSYFTSGPYPRSSSVPQLGSSISHEPPLPTHVIRKSESRKERDTAGARDGAGARFAHDGLPEHARVATIDGVPGRLVQRSAPASSDDGGEAAPSPVARSRRLDVDGWGWEWDGHSGMRTPDRPPRVPSPPMLPSLAQMGLEHSNPDAFADYRSPTYSIYNLYGSDRKSGVL
ncbi:hypothetical protein BD626DRAFT_514422 [Schizophyllum amplum]|uniref:Uncharacterized protein n=1 Tax=Schizophyllum amplum TaxID=97359 RepID=A0A550BYF8_9AGAR|nr:hypothetical protein BD626DRAFT_514422 [Auriculariopsis ampla]